MTDPAPSSAAPAASAAMAAQRTNMVDSQIRPSDITDRRIIRAMGQVPRELFVPAAYRAIAYMDNPVVLARTPQMRTLMEPRLFAKLVQLASIPDGGRVLEIGCGSGYGLAVLAAMGCKAVGIEENADLAGSAKAALAQTGSAAPVLKNGPLPAGAPDDGPFDAILVSGSAASIPASLFDQLKSGGRLVAVLGTGPDAKATVWLRSGTATDAREAFDASACPLPGFTKAAVFSL